MWGLPLVFVPIAPEEMRNHYQYSVFQLILSNLSCFHFDELLYKYHHDGQPTGFDFFTCVLIM